MTERDYLGFVLWALAFMIVVGGMSPSMWPSLVRFVDRGFLKKPRNGGHGGSHRRTISH